MLPQSAYSPRHPLEPQLPHAWPSTAAVPSAQSPPPAASRSVCSSASTYTSQLLSHTAHMSSTVRGIICKQVSGDGWEADRRFLYFISFFFYLHAGQFLLHQPVFLPYIFILFLHFCKTTAKARENLVAFQNLVLDILYLQMQTFIWEKNSGTTLVGNLTSVCIGIVLKSFFPLATYTWAAAILHKQLFVVWNQRSMSMHWGNVHKLNYYDLLHFNIKFYINSKAFLPWPLDCCF